LTLIEWLVADLGIDPSLDVLEILACLVAQRLRAGEFLADLVEQHRLLAAASFECVLFDRQEVLQFLNPDTDRLRCGRRALTCWRARGGAIGRRHSVLL